MTSFRSTDSLADEMKFLERLREQDQAVAAALVDLGRSLVQLATQGRVREMQHLLDYSPHRIPIFYGVRVFHLACSSRRVDLLHFLVSNGLDIHRPYLKNALHLVIESIHHPSDQDAAQSFLRWLLNAGMDVNWQRPGDLLAPLHLACQQNLFKTAYLLILFGADINAVANDDVMPLSCAMNASCSEQDQEDHIKLIQLLQEQGARPTWRTSTITTKIHVRQKKLSISPIPEGNEENDADNSPNIARLDTCDF